ncbi:peroxidase-related enzyme [Streptomyces sp. CAU 1734]|uniref:carboxymuconolactone decarboxylase family protein n=1 Tax=Streptomyces sp. CAU 1734 TaxID=3140360 RepID=UPI00325FFA3F
MSQPAAPPDDAGLLKVFRAHPDTARPLLGLHQRIMRGPSPFTAAERELMAAYVSGLNDCAYCHRVHTATAEALSVPAGAVTAALTDLATAPVGDRLRPVLRYLRVLTLTPARVTGEDTEAVLAAGWDERALHDAVMVCALFNFMNRMVHGLGVRADQSSVTASANRLHRHGYSGIAALLGP